MNCQQAFCNDKSVYTCLACGHRLCEWHYNFHNGWCPVCTPPKMVKNEREKE